MPGAAILRDGRGSLLRIRGIVHLAGQNAVFIGLVGRPQNFLAEFDFVQRRLGNIHIAVSDQLRQVAVKEGQQQGTDMVAVRVGVHQQTDLVVAQLGDVAGFADPAAQGRHNIAQLLVGQDFLERGLLGVEHLAA